MAQKMKNPKVLIPVAILVVIVVVAAIYYTTTTPKKASTLRVMTWTGDEDEKWWQPFKEKHPDVKVEFSFFTGTPEALTKLIGGFRPDLTSPCGMIEKFYEAGVIEPIDTSMLTNWKDVYPALKEFLQESATFNGKLYFVPNYLGGTSIIYRKDIFASLGIPEPKSYADVLFNEKLDGKITVCDAVTETLPCIALAAGIPKDSVWNMSTEQLEILSEKTKIVAKRTRALWTSSAEAVNLIVSGEVAAGLFWQSTYGTLLAEGYGDKVGWLSAPEEGLYGWVCGYVIVKGAHERGTYELAHDYIDAWLSPETGGEVINYYLYAHPNTRSLEHADPEIVQKMGIGEMVESIDEWCLFQSPATLEEWEEIWLEAKAEAGLG